MLQFELKAVTKLVIASTALTICVSNASIGQSAVNAVTAISACVVSPYAQELVIVDDSGNNHSTIVLDAGNCKDLTINIPSNGVYLYTRAVNSHSLLRLTKHSFFQAAWNGLPINDFGKTGVPACISRATGDFRKFDNGNGCSSEERAIGVGHISADVSEYALFIEDPYVCSHRTPTCENTDGNTLLRWSHDLSRSLAISYRAWTEAHKTYGLIPTASGLLLKDYNGSYTRGLFVANQQAPVTPLGSPVPADEGDTILAFNGEPVFDLDSYIMLAIRHGETRGYEHPYSIEFERGGAVYKAKGYLVFHRDIYGSFFLNANGTCKNKTGAILSAALQEASFYTKPILACINYDKNHPSGYTPSQCEFAVKQMTAAYRQYCSSVTVPASLVGSVFMPGRKLIETPFRKFGFSRLGSALIVEGLEETARSIITLPPGIRLENNWKSIGQQVGFGMAIGTGVRLITLKKAK